MEPQLKSQISLVSNDSYEGYNPQLLGSQELINRYWPQVALILRTCVNDEAPGLSDLERIHSDLHAGQKQLFVVHNDMDVKLAIVTEVNEYADMAALSIVALGGEQLELFKSKYWSAFKGWAYMNGIRTIEADVSPAMERIVKPYGFERESIRVRMPLTGE